ncbi:MAG: LysR family transcriptional regulator, partial [Emcibacteraceae bacterium]|nr:LysR family transcriptional regulator [Emcibacteraceae bacterium]
MIRPSIRQMQYLVALSEKLNFRQCAQDLNITQPTLSRQIKELEAKLGVELFERNNRKVKVTPIGEKMVERARVILNDIDHLCDTAKAASKSLGGIIHLGVPPSFGPYLLPFIIPKMHKDYPDLKLHITEAPPRELEIGLDQGKYDLLLSTTPALL